MGAMAWLTRKLSKSVKKWLNPMLVARRWLKSARGMQINSLSRSEMTSPLPALPGS
jgi:hypothetical protein